MFTKGARFEPLKVPDVPGPNSYNIPQDSALESYKRGAFLEKQDRFMKDKRPISSGANNKASGKSPTQPPIEKYNALQRKVEDLERVHLEGKRIHHAELERVKQELSSALKASAENAERFEKQKKQNSLLDARLLELKKTNLSDQSELKELRHKIRVLELEREKVSAKQPEISELKKSIAALEAKRKDDMRERDKRILELEKLLHSEQKKREHYETKDQESKRVLEEEKATFRKTTNELEGLLHTARSEARVAEQQAHNLEKEAADEKESLLQRLEQHRRLLNTVAEQYGNLVAQSVSSTTHNRLQQEQHALQFRIFRLERKLANSEGQVIELTHLIRQINSQNVHLAQLVFDAFAEASAMSTFDYTRPILADPIFSPEEGHPCDGDQRICLAELDASTQNIFSTYYQLKSDELQAMSLSLLDQCQVAQALADHRASDLSSALASHEAIAACLESTRKEKMEIEENLKSKLATMENLTARVALLETQLAESREELRTSTLRHTTLLQNEKDVINRLTSTVQKNRMAEDALRAEIDRLSAEVVEAEGYEEAYNGLLDEVQTLLTRNQLAEEEAERISKFNAEIIGHKNPAQRIMYVDRIRRELAEAKHRIAMLCQEQENVAAQNDDLQHELDMYKSVAVPLEKKPRTNLTRILRPPLVSLGNSLNLSSQRASSGVAKYQETVVEPSKGDMTTDELVF